MLSLNDIEVLMHCHCRPVAHPRHDALAVQQALRMFVTEGLVVAAEGNTYRTTDRGAAHLAQLCAASFPKQAWLTEHNTIIEI